ncbi:hypothetical protein AB0A95_30595 [Micromonospora sp. NPDC049230]
MDNETAEELATMQSVTDLLARLDPVRRARVLRWLVALFSVPEPTG